jgi:hypothetical protein
VRCVRGFAATIRACCPDLRRPTAQGADSSTQVSRSIVADWSGAGTFFGLSLGAAFGMVLGALAGFGAASFYGAFLGIWMGAPLGLASGIALGVINGIELACLFRWGCLGVTRRNRRRRAALAAGLTSAVVSFAFFDWALGDWTLGANEGRWLWVYLPAALATIVGVALSQVLEPIRSEGPAVSDFVRRGVGGRRRLSTAPKLQTLGGRHHRVSAR